MSPHQNARAISWAKECTMQKYNSCGRSEIVPVVLLCAAVFSFFFLSPAVVEGEPSAAELLAQVDDNEVYDTITYTGEMIIEYQGRRYEKRFEAVAKENSDSFIEFVNQEDLGTKYLKRSGRLYVYSPDSEQVMLISGHLLKESMMGSDLSYEDTIENNKMSDRYNPSLIGSDTIDGHPAWVLDLAAKKESESYPRRKFWVDKENGDLLHAEFYALSGAKLKEYSLIRADVIHDRRFPVEFEMRDLLRKNSRTLFIMHDVVLDAPVNDSVFSMRNLER